MTQSVMDELFAFAESPGLFVEASLANDITSLKYILVSSPQLEAAARAIENQPVLAQEVLERIGTLLTLALPTDELHEYDVAIAAYLFVLQRSNAHFLDKALSAVRESKLPNLYWAYAMYNQLIALAPNTAEDVYAHFEEPVVAEDSDAESSGPVVLRRSDQPATDMTQFTDVRNVIEEEA